jgi:uncharacterized protein YbjT (DUF2867 family)
MRVIVRVVVLGAGGQLGREVVRALDAHGYGVIAAVRRPPPSPLGAAVEIRLTDAAKKSEIRTALKGCDAVVNAIGAGTLRRNDVESTTTTAAVAAAQDVGVSRYIAMSAGMVALDWFFFKYLLHPLIFRNIVAEHRRVEEIVRGSTLNWTIVRPPKLTNGPPMGYVASLEPQPKLFNATRADVAAFIADELQNNTYVGRAVFVASKRATSSGMK